MRVVIEENLSFSLVNYLKYHSILRFSLANQLHHLNYSFVPLLFEMDLMTMNNWNFCEELESLQQDHLLTDCILVAQEDGHEIQAHQNVLAARSPFFRSLFVRKRQELADLTVKIRVELNCPTTPVYGDTVKLVVSYAYTGKVRLTRCSLEAVFLVADYWILPGLMQLCCEYLTGQLDTTNCLGIWRLAKIYGQTELSTRAKRFALRCMSECAKSPEFQQLTSLELRSLLADDYLNVPSEDKVVEIIYKWVGNSRYRRMNVSDLLFTVRMGLSQLDRPLTLHNLMLRPRIPHEILFTVGGWTNGSPTNCIETYDHKAHCWFPTKMAVDKNPRAYHGLAVLNGLLYTIGGFDGTDYFNSVRRFDPQTCEWCEVAPMYTARCYVSVAVLNGLIFAVGGFNGFDRLNTAERYDPTRNQWTLVSPMHKPRSDASLATFNGLLYVVGGFDGM